MPRLSQLSRSIAGRVALVTGAASGMGRATAHLFADEGAEVAVLDRAEAGVAVVVEEIEKAGGKALPVLVDIRFEEQVNEAVKQAVDKFGGIDVLVNNASAIFLAGTIETPMKRYDLMHQVNARGTFACSQACLPYLKQAENPHILTLASPLNMKTRWFGPHVAYTMAKYGMSMCVLGMAEELKESGIAVNALWPRTGIATAAVRNLLGGEEMIQRCREPEIMADAAHAILKRDSREFTGHFCIDEEILREEGVNDFDHYAVKPGTTDLMKDFFI